MRQKYSALLWVILVGVGIGLLAFLSPDPFSGTANNTTVNPQEEAYSAARELIKKRLKSPLTARVSRYEDEDAAISKIDNECAGKIITWKASGSLDAQNELGSMIRQRWSLKFYYNSGDNKWRSIESAIGE